MCVVFKPGLHIKHLLSQKDSFSNISKTGKKQKADRTKYPVRFGPKGKLTCGLRCTYAVSYTHLEERKLQRLFRDPEVTRLIRRCNDFGAGGVSVAIGELADGLDIDLDAVRKKYDGLDGTELAISESQERMAVVVADADVDTFLAHAARENLEAYVCLLYTSVNGINGRTRIIRLNKPSARETARAASLSGWVGAASRPNKK